MLQGLIVKALSGYYYVLPDEAAHGDMDKIVQCRARGIFKKQNRSPLVGDRVVYQHSGNGEGMIDDILPRTVALIRPPIANVQQVILVFSASEPVTNRILLDRFVVHIENAGLNPIICITKRDLLQQSDFADPAAEQELANIISLYTAIGYRMIHTSAQTGEGIADLEKAVASTISVLAGQSGVGKSSLLNAMLPHLELATNEISMRLGRGKHTTRHVELLPLRDGGWIADTPGFSQLDFIQLGVTELSQCFREFVAYGEDCRFRGCEHLNEPGCAVIAAVEQGHIAQSRHTNYQQFAAEIKDHKRRY